MSPQPATLEPPVVSGPGMPVTRGWSPRWDPEFEHVWLTYLLSRFWQWCHAKDVWAPCTLTQADDLRKRAHEVVEGARRLGLLIDSDDVLGYRVTGHAGLPKYLRLKEPEPQQVTGQLTLEGVGA